ncbi:C45 family autoproteolytic acyltransferase/hydolase [Microbacterium paraoxydans]|uniref:C45 family autoproteolytic acyltransferase/hydolase n=1 Tax=Microbacterium paraoxydans TaxID=199592 RepID=UPI001CF9458E|nr:C45 family peptidase [Microbacterium paraoxydans]
MTIRRFETDEVDPFARGAAIGRFSAEGIVWNLRSYRELFTVVGVDAGDLPRLGLAALENIERWSPALGAEARGLAEGAGVQPWEIGMLNARTEILAIVGAIGEGECSTVVTLDQGRAPWTMQTWDWHDVSNDDQLVVRARVRPDREVRYFTEFGILGKVGVNDAGLGSHFNILNHDDDGGEIGVPVHAVARRVLDDARDFDDAIRIARSAPVSASTVLTVVAGDAEGGRAVSIELSPGGAAVVHPDEDGLLVHTNHFLDATLAEGEMVPDKSSTFPRLTHLRERSARLRTADPVARAQAMLVHEADGAAVCCHPDPALTFEHRWETLTTIGVDVERAELQFHEGGPCRVTREGWQSF